MYVYLRSELTLWTVGHYDPRGKWHAESDHGTPEEAAARVASLNGDKDPENDRLRSLAQALERKNRDLGERTAGLLAACNGLLARVDTWGDVGAQEIQAIRRAVARASGSSPAADDGAVQR